MIKLPGGGTKIAVLAIGGNAIAPPQGPLTWKGQLSALRNVAPRALHLRDLGYKLVITHGNGPQVGAILLQNERASDMTPPNPLDVCVAQSQAQIGYALQLTLQEELRRMGERTTVLPVVTMVVVDPEDSEFHRPSKPIGPLYDEARARKLKAGGWRMVRDSRGGYRRVVPSPRPLEILGVEFLRKALLQDDVILIAAGGGGVPVIRGAEGLEGVEAVVDKDLASCLLASDLDAEILIMVTDVPHVFLNFGTERQKPLHRLSLGEAEGLIQEGQFPPGSMGPKVQAAVEFLRKGGSRAIVTNLESMELAMEGRAGTVFTPGP
jgi:carbamate kinase